MIAELLNLLAMACCVSIGWHWHARRMAPKLATLQRENADLQRQNATLVGTVRSMAADNQRLADWCGRFRDMYLGAVRTMDPRLAMELRQKWAAVQAPEAVNRLLQRMKHG